jgi:hypothetical protein
MKIQIQKASPAAVTWLFRIALVFLYVLFYVVKKKLYL